MDEFLRLVDELRKRGATEIAMGTYSARFNAPVLTPMTQEAEVAFTPPQLSQEELEALLYKETMNM